MGETRLKLSIVLTIPLLGIATTVVTSPFSVTEHKLLPDLMKVNALALETPVLTPQEVNLRAKQITVRIDGAGIGTGVIVDESDATYTVLTNWHVVQQSGEYFVKTVDGRKYAVDYNTVRQLPNLDLAILEFERKQNYQLAEVGDSNRLIEGQNLYFAGYPGELRKEDNRYYRFFSASLVGVLPESTANGYSLVYNGEAFPGMSGGPVLNSEGLLIGIHGETNIHALTGGTSNYAIPINRYRNAIAQIASATTTENNDLPNSNSSATQPDSNSSVTQPSNSNNSSATQPDSNSSATQPDSNNSVTQPDSNNSSATPSVTVNTVPPEQNSPTEKTAPQNRALVVRESSPDTESVATTPNEANSTENRTTPLNSPPSSNTDNNQKPSTIVSVPTLSNPSENSQQPSISKPKQKPELISRTTGIDYKPLKELLISKKWQEADRQTQTLVARIIDTAKRQNTRSFISINAIAEYACRDIYIIDSIWQQYSDRKFGFSPQQKIWQNINQNSDFSLNTWRSFVTKIGWKQGDISNSSGYLLYEQLTFDPKTAPQGHLPWWFAASEEQQNIIKTIFNRCSLRRIDNSVNETDADDSEPFVR